MNWSPNKDRIVGLDILRSIAILMLLLSHSKNLLPEKFHSVYRLFVFDGVSIFFVLSGFLIGGILIRTWESSQNTVAFLRKFWRRRWLRTLPPYFLVLIVVIGFTWWLKPTSLSSIPLFDYFFFVQNFASPHPFFFPEAWSLSVEEWFYLMLPLCWLFLIRLWKGDPKKLMLYLAVTAILFTIVYRWWRFSNLQPIDTGSWDLVFRKQVVTRLDGIMIGVLMAYLWDQFKASLIYYRKVAFILGLVSFFGIRFLEIIDFIPPAGQYDAVFSFTLFALGTAALIPVLMTLKIKSRLFIGVFTFLSLTSYSMYLVNLTLVQHLIIPNLPWNLLTTSNAGLIFLNYFLFWVLTIGISTLLYYFFERPILKFRDKI